MNGHDIIKAIQNWFHSLVADLKPALDVVEQNGGAIAINLAEQVIAGLAAGTSWDAIIAAFIPEAEKAGIKLAEDVASIILNIAKANLLAKAKNVA